MKKLSIYCLTMNPEHQKFIENLNYIPVGLGERKFPDSFLNDKSGVNISEKNNHYGEYTFHYWIWKNYLNKIESEWVGFCQYRKFFTVNKINQNELSFNELKKNILTNISEENEKYSCILGNKFSVENFKFIKSLKKNPLRVIFSPSAIFNRSKRNLKFHFDIFHGDGNLSAAISLLDNENKDDFKNFMLSKTSFNPHNMFICKKKLLIRYYESVFPWLEKCENIFGFTNLKGYGLKRIYGFLAERYLSYWFTKNAKVKELPILVKDLSDYKDL